MMCHLFAGVWDSIAPGIADHLWQATVFVLLVAGLVFTLFWFHPLVWWLELRLAEKRETACDQNVLALCGQSRAYAESIPKVCEFCVEPPLVCVSGVTGSDLKRRVAGIITTRALPHMTWPKKLLLATTAVCILAAPVVQGQAKAAPRMMLAATQAAPVPVQSVAHAMMAAATPSSSGVAEPTSLLAQTSAAAAPASTSPASRTHFDLTAIRPSPFANHPHTTIEYLPDGRLVARQVTMLELIRTAWNAWTSDRNRILRGPSWLDLDRFDIDAHAPRGTSIDDMRLMLRALLIDRFSLVVHTGTKPMPAYILTVAKGGPILKPAAKATDDADANSGCYSQRQQQDPPYNLAICKNATMAELAAELPVYGFAGGTNDYLSATVVDQTGLTGTYDFQFKWTPRPALIRVGSDGITLFDALDKQLGLKLEPKPAPLPVLYVDSVNEKPTPNAPGLDKTLAPPLVEVEVATFKPSAPGARGPGSQPPPDELIYRGVTLQSLITDAWNISDDMLADAPKWLNQDRWDLVAKLAHDPANGKANLMEELSEEQTAEIVKKLLADRFGLKVHLEDRPAEAYALVAANPHMKKADPDNRTGCHEGPGDDGKDPRLANPALTRLMTCQNMTMAQFGDMLRVNASGYIHSPVLDQTGLSDAYDFTIAFSGAGMLRIQPGDAAAGEAAAPTGAVSLFDAVQKEMGVKLVNQKRPVQMLVIDHINERPTEN